MSFLNNKSFHPGNAQNRFKLFEAEEKKKAEDRKKEELKREFEQQQAKRELAGTIKGGDPTAPMAFMYTQPPGLINKHSKDKTPAERDVERHGELLKNAPRQGAYTTQIDVVHKPFGVELRKVRCTKCSAWGHQAGDRECPLRNQLHPLDIDRREREDPVRMAGAESSGAALRWAPKAAPDTGAHGDTTADDANQQFVSALDEEELLGASVAGQMSDVAILAQVDPELLAMLNEKQQRKLIRKYRAKLMAGGSSDKKPKKSKKEKKHKDEKKQKKDKGKDKEKKKRKRSSSSSSGETSESEQL